MYKLLIVLFVVLSLIHLYTCYIENEKIRRITKMMLMPCLLLTAYFSVENLSLLIAAALTAGFIGDFFMIYTENPKSIMAGIASFIIGHLFYMNIMWSKIPLTLSLSAVVVGILSICMVVILYNTLKKNIGEMKIPAIIYMSILGLLFFFSMNTLLINFNINSVILIIGTLFFICSDYIIAYTMFVKKISRPNFYIMLTYIIAQSFLIIALV